MHAGNRTKAVVAVFVFAVLFAGGISVPVAQEGEAEPESPIRGAWRHFDFYYSFGDSVMTAVKIDTPPRGYRTYPYTIERMGPHRFVRFKDEHTGSDGVNLLALQDVTDSTAVIAMATSFVRADSTRGFFGTWKRSERYDTFTMSVGRGTIAYNHTRFDPASNLTATVERHTGTYTPGKGRFTGRFFVTFSDSTKITLFPVVFDRVMYLFDLSPRKSFFRRVDRVPSYEEYREAVDGENGQVSVQTN